MTDVGRMRRSISRSARRRVAMAMLWCTVAVAPTFCGLRPWHSVPQVQGRCGLAAQSADVEPPSSDAWDASVQVLVDNVDGCSPEDADAWLREGFAWTRKSKRFWRTSRSQVEPDPETVEETLQWLQAKGVARKDWVKKFPVAIGLSASDLELSRSTAPDYLRKDAVFLSAIKANPPLLGNNFDCLAETDSCQGRCARCWNT
mmetsp:Transcript_5030/g.12069  ORF Transcript_5030/g.12069 Transcript_5030/m.12069 type:complete len:202 (-) Transcript_5030:48-653(-)